jgi:hypothetical protein
MALSFVPTPDVCAVVHILLDVYERRNGTPQHAVRVNLDDVKRTLPSYSDQADPIPRTTANEQLEQLETRGLVHLTWQPGQQNHLLDAVVLSVDRVDQVYELVAREPLLARRQRLQTLLLGDRFRLNGWRRKAIDHCVNQLKIGRPVAPFNLDDDGWNRDLLAALLALPDDGREEIPYRVFSVRVFNDSKRFETLKSAVARLARRHHRQWRALSNQETLRELGLVPNPGHLYLYGSWRLVDRHGQVTSLSEFHPSVGIPTALAAHVKQVQAEARRIICVENLTSFYELVRYEGQGLAALCLWGNPSPASRHLLRRLVDEMPPEVPLLLWADIDCGGLGILAQLRAQVSPRIAPYRMDRETLDAHAHWGHPLSCSDERRLAHLRRHPALADMRELIDHMLLKGIKLEQEAVSLSQASPSVQPASHVLDDGQIASAGGL